MSTFGFKKLASSCKAQRDSELRTVALLGCPMKIRKSRYFFQLQVTVRSPTDNGMPPESRISCKMVFMCPTFYPRLSPEVHIRSKRNFPGYLESAIYSEYERVWQLYQGTQYIVLMVSSALYMMEKEDLRSSKALEYGKYSENKIYSTTKLNCVNVTNR